MNNLISNFIFLLIFAIAKSQNGTCDRFKYTDIAHKNVNLSSACSASKPCIVKCCAENEVYFRITRQKQTCRNIDDIKKEYNLVDWSTIPFGDYSGLEFKEAVEGRVSPRKFDSFKILLNEDYRLIKDCVFMIKPLTLLENGNMVMSVPHTNGNNPWKEYVTFWFCVEMHVYIHHNNMKNVSHNFEFMLHKDNLEVQNEKQLFVAITFTISSFFLVLVLIVYPMCDMLNNLQGLLLYAYVGTRLVTQLIKATFFFVTLWEYKLVDTSKKTDCTLTYQFYYFFELASFLWLNVMSFDIWWTFRGRLKNRAIHRRGIRVKFMIYALYAYGTSAAVTIFAVVFDDLPDNALAPYILKPKFKSCLDADTIFYFLFIPIIIITALNTFWFSMTVYNIWQSKKAITNFDKRSESTKSKTDTKIRNKKTFYVYLRLSLLMGISWILELSQTRLKYTGTDIPLWAFVLLNLYTMLTGLFIFIMFVCKRDVLRKLCKRFNIDNRWTRRLLASSRHDSNKTTSKSSRSTERSKVAGNEEDPPSTDHSPRSPKVEAFPKVHVEFTDPIEKSEK